MRKTRAKKRPLLPDPRFNDTLVTRFVNNLMYSGKKSVAYAVFYEAIDIVSQKTEEGNGLELWKEALNNVMPHVEVRSRCSEEENGCSQNGRGKQSIFIFQILIKLIAKNKNGKKRFKIHEKHRYCCSY